VDGFVHRQLGLHRAVGCGERGVVVEVYEVLGFGEVGEPLVQLDDLRGGREAGVPGEMVGGQDRRDDHTDVVGLGERDHGAEVVVNRLHGFGPGVLREIVGAGQDDDGCGLQVDDVLLEADEHLGGGLAADTAIEPRLAREEFARLAAPMVGKRVAVEDDALGAGRGRADLFVFGGVASELGEVVEARLELVQLLLGCRRCG